MVNLLILLLLCYHIRMIVQSLQQHDFVLRDVVSYSHPNSCQFNRFLLSGALFEIENYSTLAAITSMSLVFPLTSFIIEILAARGVPDFFVRKIAFSQLFQIISMIISTLSVLMAYPVVLIQYLKSDTLSAVYFMMFAVGLSLKMISFHHVVYDNRTLLRRI